MHLPDDTALVISPVLKQRAQSILQALKASHMSIVTAESCTAGMIAAVLSRAEGAGSAPWRLCYLHEGATAPSMKRLFANGALERSPASLGLAISGVLGPEAVPDPCGALVRSLASRALRSPSGRGRQSSPSSSSRSKPYRITSWSWARLWSLSNIASPSQSHHTASPSIVADAGARAATASLMRG
jgi:nicotinamide-nucleotide amidase